MLLIGLELRMFCTRSRSHTSRPSSPKKSEFQRKLDALNRTRTADVLHPKHESYLQTKLLSKRQPDLGWRSHSVCDLFFLDGWRGRTYLEIFFFGGGPFAEKITRRAGTSREATKFSLGRDLACKNPNGAALGSPCTGFSPGANGPPVGLTAVGRTDDQI